MGFIRFGHWVRFSSTVQSTVGSEAEDLYLGKTVSVLYKRKKVQKVRNFFRHFHTEILRILAFFLPPKTGDIFSCQKP